MLKSIWRKLKGEPLLHFLAAALALFAVFALINPNDRAPGDKEIVVTRQNLLTYMQYRAKVFDPEQFQALYQSLPAEDRSRLVADYVREEAMYREAKALNLDRNDYVAKRRLIQQLEFVTEGTFDSEKALSGEDVRAYYDRNQEKYRVPPKITFTHVFFSNDLHGEAQAEALAKRALGFLNAKRVPFDRATQHGDRPLYHVNYVQKDSGLLASHFGPEMADALFKIEPSATQWRGPYVSPYGAHLVLLISKDSGRVPALEDIRDRVAADAQAERKDERRRSAIASIVSSYRVRYSKDLEPVTSAKVQE